MPTAQPATQWPSPCSVHQQQLTIFSGEYYQEISATHLPTS